MNRSQTQTLFHNPFLLVKKVYEQAGGVYTACIALVLFSLEIFNFSTTKFALQDLMGDVGIGIASWATILAGAFCGIDLIGVIRLFSPQSGKEKNKEGYFLLGAWLVSAVMNTVLTWWGISIAIYNHPVDSVLVVDPMTIVTVIPIFVSLMVMLIRILLIGNLANVVNRVKASLAPYAKKSQPTTGKPFGLKPTPTQNTYRRSRTAPVSQGMHVFSSNTEMDQ